MRFVIGRRHNLTPWRPGQSLPAGLNDATGVTLLWRDPGTHMVLYLCSPGRNVPQAVSGGLGGATPLRGSQSSYLEILPAIEAMLDDACVSWRMP